MRRLGVLAFLAIPLGAVIGCARAAAVPAPRGNAVAQSADLAVFEEGFFDVDRSYGREARAEAKRRLDKLKASPGTVSDTRFILALSQIAALADNGHTGIVYRGNARELGRVGLRLAPFGEDFVVIQTDAENEFLSGGRLVSVDGHPLSELVAAARTLTGGPPSHRDRMAPIFLESPGQLQALGLAREAEHATYTFALLDGTRREARLVVTSAPGDGFDGSMAILSPENAPSGWRTLLPREKEPWALEEIGETQRRRDLPEADAILIQLRSNLDGARPLAAFLDEAEAARRKARRRNVILDMRMNGGGNLQLTQEWMSRLPGRLPAVGRVVVLISPWTFSAAISSVGYLKQAGGERVILVGEPPGDRLNFFAEGRPTNLPNSGAVVLTATQRHDYVTGCRGFTDCHQYVVDHPVAVRNLDPEIEAPWTLDAYVAGRDPGLEAAMKTLARSARK